MKIGRKLEGDWKSIKKKLHTESGVTGTSNCSEYNNVFFSFRYLNFVSFTVHVHVNLLRFSDVDLSHPSNPVMYLEICGTEE